MKIRINIILLALIFLVLPMVTQSQQIDTEIKKISLKLKKDKNYLNLNYLTTQLDSNVVMKLQDVPRISGEKTYSFSGGTNTQYRIVFLNKGIGLESIYLMYVDEIKLNTLNSESFFADETATDDTVEVLMFKDLYTLKLNNSEQYATLLELVTQYVEENEVDNLPSLLGINPDARDKPYMGMTSRDNTDYFNFQRTNSPHYVPKEKKKSRSVRGGASSEKSYRIDASFSKITFSHKALDYSIGTTGFEVSTQEPILNLLPFEASNIHLGFRSILRISGEKRIKHASYIDAKLVSIISLNSSSIFNNQPFVSADTAKLNINSGFGGEINLTKFFGFPYITLKGYMSNTDFENPTYFIPTSETTKDAYFSSAQFEGTFSFYWNTSPMLTSRLRFDLGVGYFNIWKNSYNAENEITYSDIESEDYVVPIIALHYTFVPSEIPLLGLNLRYFDSRITLGGWIKIFEFAPENILRLEVTAITEPIARLLQPWESSGGIFFQFRYRYGL